MTQLPGPQPSAHSAPGQAQVEQVLGDLEAASSVSPDQRLEQLERAADDLRRLLEDDPVEG